MTRVGAVILAAGKGTRMRSRHPKVTHALGGRPLVEHVLRAAAEALSNHASNATAAASSTPDSASGTPEAAPDDAEDHSPRYIVVLGHEREQVRAAITWTPPLGSLHYATQQQPLGTGDALRAARSQCVTGTGAPTTILVLYGDTPLVRPATLRALLDAHARSAGPVTFLTGIAPDPEGYGRVVRDAAGSVRGIVEQRHASAVQQRITEVNSGIYCFDAAWLWPHLEQLTAHPGGELYLTDLVDVAVAKGHTVATVSAPIAETMGINDRVQLAEAEAVLRQRVLRDLMLAGVTVEDPATTYVEVGVRVGQDTILRPGTLLQGATDIGADCVIGPSSVIRDSRIGDGCIVLGSWLDGATMDAGARVGPMSRLRGGAHLRAGAHVGNFGEVKNATIGEQVQMHHFSYIGDAHIGAQTNIGAGTITMNYDGTRKHHTEIGRNVFLGSDTLLRAPVTVGDGAATGGGAVVTRDVAPGTLVAGVPAREMPRKTAHTQQQSGGVNGNSTSGHPPQRRSAKPRKPSETSSPARAQRTARSTAAEERE